MSLIIFLFKRGKFCQLEYFDNMQIGKSGHRQRIEAKKERMIPINDTIATVSNNRIPKVFNISLDEYVFCVYPGVPYLKDYVRKTLKEL